MPKEFLMRILAFAILAIGMLSVGGAAAQTYDPAYPVCLQLYGDKGNYIDCSYTSLTHCSASASGRAAQCFTNSNIARSTKKRGGGTGRRW
jgi:Protein of unknown function (DUF3551)